MLILVTLAALLFLALAFGPWLWVAHVMRAEGAERPDLPGTGGELARHLLDAAGLSTVRVERTDEGDHYDPATRAVRLLPAHLEGRSVAAVAVAAHEVAHAVQHAWNEPAFRRRQALVGAIAPLDRAARLILLSMPVLFVVAKSPALLAAQLILSILFFAGSVAIHAVTLPVELDASFGKALPVLQRGAYLGPSDLPAARRVLRAAALTYVAAALADVLNLLRWLGR